MAALAPDPAAFRALEHAGWQRAARHYDDAFGSLTRQAIDPLLDSAEVRSGALTLDVASGPGYAAAAAGRVSRRWIFPPRWWSSRARRIRKSSSGKATPRRCRFRRAASTRW